jgi:hypothetical protein
MEAGTRNGRVRKRSRRSSDTDIDGMKSTCIHNDAAAVTSTAVQRIAVQIVPRMIDGMAFERVKESISEIAHRNCAITAMKNERNYDKGRKLGQIVSVVAIT